MVNPVFDSPVGVSPSVSGAVEVAFVAKLPTEKNPGATGVAVGAGLPCANPDPTKTKIKSIMNNFSNR